jgi:HlyD family secretion protein
MKELQPENTERKTIFREKALRKKIEGENIDELLIMSPTYSKYAFSYFLVMFAIVIFWLFFGALTIEIKGKGIFMNEGGVFGIESQTNGYVKEIYVKPGNYIKKNELIASLYNPEQEISLSFTNRQLNELESDYERFKSEFGEEDRKNKEALRQQIESNRLKIKKLEGEIPVLEEAYHQKLDLSQEGLISTTALLDAEKLLIQRKKALETTKSTIILLESNLTKSYKEEELQKINQRILDEKEIKNSLELNLKNNQIYSPFNAHILEVLVYPGDRVTRGKNILWLESGEKQEENVVIYAFVYLEIGKRIPLGVQILVEPIGINEQEYGSLIGHVTSVSPYAVGSKEIETYIHSKGLQNYLTTGLEIPFLMTIKPEVDRTTASGFKWTSEKGSPFKISTGSVCNITGIAYYERPIVRLIPLWKIETYFNEFKDWIDEAHFLTTPGIKNERK